MTSEFYEKTPSLSLRLRVPRTRPPRKPNSNKLECYSSSFELIRVSPNTPQLQVSNKLEFSRIPSNKLERARGVAHE